MAENGMSVVQAAEETTRSVRALSGGADAFNQATRMAMALAGSTIVPAAYQGNVSNVIVAMEYANRLGASVLAVMQNLHLINGKPSLSATFLIGTVNACGRFTPIRWRFEGTPGKDDWGCRAVAVDKESGEECPGPLITIALAKNEGWYDKKGSKWKTIAELMLQYRAATWWTRLYCPELSLGLHSTDEAEDVQIIPPEQRVRGVAAALDAPDEEPEAVDGAATEGAEAQGSLV